MLLIDFTLHTNFFWNWSMFTCCSIALWSALTCCNMKKKKKYLNLDSYWIATLWNPHADLLHLQYELVQIWSILTFCLVRSYFLAIMLLCLALSPYFWRKYQCQETHNLNTVQTIIFWHFASRTLTECWPLTAYASTPPPPIPCVLCVSLALLKFSVDV